MKIAFLSRYSGTVDRGVETYVQELAARLAKNNQIDVLTGKDSDNFLKIVKGGYDIVIPTNGRLQALKASLGRMFSRYKVIISSQSGSGIDDIFNIFIVKPDIFVALTDFTANGKNNKLRRAKTWAWGTKVVTIPNGVDLNKFKPNGPKADIKLKKPVILSVGALTWYKNHISSIEALHKVAAGSLLIIGNGPERDKLQKKGNELLDKDRFQILQVPYENIPHYYRGADVFVLPSWSREAFGIVYLEAMASGLPVVAPDDPQRREIIGEAGVFVKNVNDHQAYGNAILEALSKKWGDIPVKQAEKFSWDEIATKYEKLFKQLLNKDA